MATQQAWDDFCALKAQVGYAEGELSNVVKDSIDKLEVLVSGLVADPARAASVIALADQHPHWTSAHIFEVYNKLLTVRTAIIAQGF